MAEIRMEIWNSPTLISHILSSSSSSSSSSSLELLLPPVSLQLSVSPSLDPARLAGASGGRSIPGEELLDEARLMEVFRGPTPRDEAAASRPRRVGVTRAAPLPRAAPPPAPPPPPPAPAAPAAPPRPGLPRLVATAPPPRPARVGPPRLVGRVRVAAPGRRLPSPLGAAKRLFDRGAARRDAPGGGGGRRDAEDGGRCLEFCLAGGSSRDI